MVIGRYFDGIGEVVYQGDMSMVSDYQGVQSMESRRSSVDGVRVVGRGYQGVMSILFGRYVDRIGEAWTVDGIMGGL
jgi:hypothetical protein